MRDGRWRVAHSLFVVYLVALAKAMILCQILGSDSIRTESALWVSQGNSKGTHHALYLKGQGTRLHLCGAISFNHYSFGEPDFVLAMEINEE